MRKLGVAALALGTTLVMTTAAAAQPAPSALTVLANVEHYYANANQLTAMFRQTVTLASFGTSKTNDGQLRVAKPSDFRFDYMTVRNRSVVVTKSFVADGTTLWVVDHDNKQIVQSQVQASLLPAAVAFLTGGTALASQFTVASNTSGTYGDKGDLVLELTPLQPSAQYKRLFFVVDPSNWRVKSSIVIDANDNANQFTFFRPDLTATTKASWFQVNPASLPTYKLVQVGQTSSVTHSTSGSGSGSTAP